jgi:hypothetical protein
MHIVAVAATLGGTRASSEHASAAVRRRRAVALGVAMQSARPRDVGVLVFVIGLFLVLFVVTLLVGSPVR